MAIIALVYSQAGVEIIMVCISLALFEESFCAHGLFYLSLLLKYLNFPLNLLVCFSFILRFPIHCLTFFLE